MKALGMHVLLHQTCMNYSANAIHKLLVDVSDVNFNVFVIFEIHKFHVPYLCFLQLKIIVCCQVT